MRETASPHDNHHRAIDLGAGLDRVMGDRDMYLRVLARFRADYRDTAARLRAALDHKDIPLAQRIAHTLKGAAAMIEARVLRQLALDVELALRARGKVDAEVMAKVDAELARVLVELDGMLDAPLPVPVAAPATLEAIGRLRAMLDIGDSEAIDVIKAQRPGLLAALGAERMQALDAAVRVFDFERAVAVLDGSAGA